MLLLWNPTLADSEKFDPPLKNSSPAYQNFPFPPAFENSKISFQPSIYGGKDTMKNIWYLTKVIWAKNFEHKFKKYQTWFAFSTI